QYIEHTFNGVQPTAPDQGSWAFTWTAPAISVGRVTFYAAGNAANGDGTNQNDFIYTTSVNIQPGCPSISVSPSSSTLPPGTAGDPYSQTFTATGGTAPHTFTISAGMLPPGLNLSIGGVLSGTPTGFGTFNFTVRATDSALCFGERAYSLLINPPCPAITVNP